MRYTKNTHNTQNTQQTHTQNEQNTHNVNVTQALNRSMPNQSQLVCFNEDHLSMSTGKKVLNYQCQTNWQDLVSCQYQSGAPSYKYQSGAPSYQCQINVQNPEPVRFKQ